MSLKHHAVFLVAGVLVALAPARPIISAQVPARPATPPAGRSAASDAAQTAAARTAPAMSPAERELRAWLEAFNRGGRGTYLQFLQAHFPSRAAAIDRDLDFRQRTGGFTLRKIEAATATSASAIVEDRQSEQFARVSLDVEAAPPYRIERMAIAPIERPAEFPAPRMTEAELVSALRARLGDGAAKDQFSGAVLVGRAGKALFEAAYGLADREKRVANTVRTRFRMGSMNKMFTATAVLQLAQAGRIKLDDPLGRYVTDYPNKDVANKVTIHHLLTHTGGTGDIFGPEFAAHRLELRTLDDYVKLYGARGLEFEPGSRWAYSNYGFILLGVLIQRVSGQSYYDYVRDHIFVPAGMTATGSEPEDVEVAGRSTGYLRQAGLLKPNTDTLPYRGTSAGGGYTTVGDLFRFATALTGRVLLDARHTELLTTGKVDAGNGGKYAYGFGDSTSGGARFFGHSGGAPGMNGELRIYPQSGYIVAALANMDGVASGISAWIGARLPK